MEGERESEWRGSEEVKEREREREREGCVGEEREMESEEGREGKEGMDGGREGVIPYPQR